MSAMPAVRIAENGSKKDKDNRGKASLAEPAKYAKEIKIQRPQIVLAAKEDMTMAKQLMFDQDALAAILKGVNRPEATSGVLYFNQEVRRTMNRIERKELAPDAAKLFEAEVLSIWPDIPRDELCDMVDDFIYYQTDGMMRAEAKAIVDRGCRGAGKRAA